MPVKATLIDVFSDGRLITLWLRKEGKNFFLRDFITPSFFIGAKMNEMEQIKNLIEKKFRKECKAEFKMRKEFTSNKFIQVLEIVVIKVSLQRTIIREIESKFNHSLDLYNSDIELDRLYLFSKNIRPMQEVAFTKRGEWAKNIKPTQFNSFTENYEELSAVHLEVIPSRFNKGLIEGIGLNKNYFYGSEKEVLEKFINYFSSLDPDVVLTREGNKFEFSLLKERLLFHKIEFNFGRFKDKFPCSKGKSYFSYGRVVRHEPAHYLKGRLHIQTSDFHYSECGLEGVYEIAHSTVLPIQKAARLGSGNCISNLQYYVAYRMGFLIPEKKNIPEKFNSGWHLFKADKGGMVFEPITGVHENVVELDFSSLYPSIMVYHNISPETILCNCCNNREVPFLHYNLCKKRTGILPQVIEPILKKRLYYKHAKATSIGKEKEKYSRMNNALKWLLVVSFGYTGYKNARFGRIEAHQAICSFAREKLLQAAQICENHGFHILHGIVDSLYIKKKNFTAQEIDGIVKEIIQKTGIEIVVEGIFKWIVFLPRISNSRISTPNKFYGIYSSNDCKVRGIQLRRKDIPLAIKKMQQEQLNLFSKANNAKEFQNLIPQAISIMKEWIAKLHNRLIPLEELALKLDVAKKAGDYSANIAQKAAIIQLEKKGVKINEGETIRFVYSNFTARNYLKRIIVLPSRYYKIDYQKYEELFIKATYELINFCKKENQTLKLSAQNIRQTTLNEHWLIPAKLKSLNSS